MSLYFWSATNAGERSCILWKMLYRKEWRVKAANLNRKWEFILIRLWNTATKKRTGGMHMKKLNITRTCNVISIFLLICFIVKTIIDYAQYSGTLNSAPFYVWIIANVLYFVLPAVIVFIVGIVIKIRIS